MYNIYSCLLVQIELIEEFYCSSLRERIKIFKLKKCLKELIKLYE